MCSGTMPRVSNDVRGGNSCTQLVGYEFHSHFGEKFGNTKSGKDAHILLQNSTLNARETLVYLHRKYSHQH